MTRLPTTAIKLANASSRPFLLLFGERIVSSTIPEVRYDDARQITQIRIGPKWVDAMEAHTLTHDPGTRTDVKHENTDDD